MRDFTPVQDVFLQPTALGARRIADIPQRPVPRPRAGCSSEFECSPELLPQPGLPGGIILDVPSLTQFGHTALLLAEQNDARKRVHTRPVSGLVIR